MRHHRPRALGAILAALLALTSTAMAVEVEHVGTFIWQEDDKDFGGFSGLEISADGQDFFTVSDRAHLRWGRFERDEQGAIRAIIHSASAHLQDSKGRPLRGGWLSDSEGLAIDHQGRFWVSFEGLHRIARYDRPDAPAYRIDSPDEFDRIRRNGGFEALAVAPEGAVIAIVERPADNDGTSPVWRWHEDDGWSQPWTIPRSGRWLPVGADFGPDGRLYVLDRAFHGVLGFSSRVRRFDWGNDGPVNGVELLQSSPAQYDNLEGIAVWDDGIGMRITLISDDNFLFLQRTELVEYRILPTD